MKVIKIGAVWCNGCLVMRPRWKKIEEKNSWLKTEYYDYDIDKDIVEKYGLDQNKLPTFIFVDSNEKIIEKIHGEIEENVILETINKHKDK